MRKLHQALVHKGNVVTLRMWVSIAVGAVFALTIDHTFASEPGAPAGPSNSAALATQSQATKDPELLKSPRPRPASADDASGMAQSDQCRWLGTRIISLLSRDDAMTAKDFNPFYERFGCPEAHLPKAFGCVVGDGGQSDGEELASRVDRCWVDPVEGRKPGNVVGDETPPETTPPETTPPETTQENSANGGT